MKTFDFYMELVFSSLIFYSKLVGSLIRPTFLYRFTTSHRYPIGNYNLMHTRMVHMTMIKF